MSDLTAQQLDQIRGKVIPLLQEGRYDLADKILKEYDLHDCVQASRQVSPVKHEFTCPHHHARVELPCQLDCKFRVQNEMANNCLLAYCHQQGVDHISADEISYLYGIPVEKVNRRLDRAMTKIRLAAVQAEAAEDPDVRQSFWFVETSKVCCVCGSTTDNGGIVVHETPLAWCSPECQEKAPADVIRLEWQFGRSVDVLLGWALKRFKNLPLLERTFGLTRPTLEDLCGRYLGKSLQEFYPKVKTTNESLSWIRRHASGVPENLFVRVKECVRSMRGKYGRGNFPLDDLKSELARTLTG